MELRKLTKSEYKSHIEKFPDDSQYKVIYELTDVRNGRSEVVHVDETTADYIKRAIAFGKRQVRQEMQAALGLIIKKD